jgi:hypothetical protein
VVGIPRSLCEELGLAVQPDPFPENPAHCLILGRKSGTIRRRLRDGCQRLRPATLPTTSP